MKGQNILICFKQQDDKILLSPYDGLLPQMIGFLIRIKQFETAVIIFEILK